MKEPHTVKVKPYEVKFLELQKKLNGKPPTYREVKKIMVSSKHTDKAVKQLRRLYD